MAHSISTLVKAAETLENSDVKFVIVGSGAERENIQNLIDEKKLKNIKIFSLRPKEEIPFIISKLDIFLVHLKKNDLFKTVIPSKIFEGMFMKKAILIGVDGEARTIIEDAKAGEFFEPENAIELCEAVNRLKNNRNKMNIYGDNGYNYVIENFDRQKSAEKFLSLIDKVVNQN
jgi:glycosyltransferase involved in cell wall biosynthesis